MKSQPAATASREVAARQHADRRECEADPLAFLQRHVEIEEPDGSPIRFRLWPFQQETVDALTDSTLAIVLKARRMGLSWIALGLALWMAIFQQGVRILILCKTEGEAIELLDRIRRMRTRMEADPASRHLLADLDSSRGRDAVTRLDIGTSVIRALVGKPSAARSETAGLVIWDEAAFQDRADEIWQGLLPTVEGGGRLWVISTGNGTTGQGAQFADMWTRASEGRSSFVPLFWPWHARPDRTPAWHERVIENLGSDDAARAEYPATEDEAFVAVGARHVFDRSAIAAAARLGVEFDDLLKRGEMAAPIDHALAIGLDWGDFATHGLVLWPLERGGLYIAPSEVATSRQDIEVITDKLLAAAAQYPYWLAEVRYDNSFSQSNRTFARMAQQKLGPHVPQSRTGRPATVPVNFSKDTKGLAVKYVRLLLRRTLQGETTRVIAISPTNPTLLEQMRNYEEDEFGTFQKGSDDAVDSLIAGTYWTARKHRKVLDEDLHDAEGDRELAA